MDPDAAAVLPNPRVRLQGHALGLMTERFKAPIERLVADAGKALIDEHLRNAENDAAVGVRAAAV